MKRCTYVKGTCSQCGRPKGWRIHKWHREQRYVPCPGRKS